MSDTEILKLREDLEKTKSKLRDTQTELEGYEGLLRLALEDMRKIYDNLLNTQGRLLQADKLSAIGLLVAGIIHDINNPLMAVQGNLSLLEEQLASGSPGSVDVKLVTELVYATQKAAVNVSALVKSIKNFSRADKGLREPADIRQVIDGVAEILSYQIKHKAELKKLYADVPTISCNAQQLSQVFMNLLINALHAIDTRGVVTVKVYKDGRWVRAEVTDTGKGIPPENLKLIFEPFFTTKGPQEGTGLGLSICADILKEHEGTLEVKSTVGSGTTFTLSLPI